MPELPEVETTLRGILPFVLQQKIIQVVVRHPRLRWPIPAHLAKTLKNQPILRLYRRAKYLIMDCPEGSLILHLGMSGRLWIAISLPVLATFTRPKRYLWQKSIRLLRLRHYRYHNINL